MNKKIFITGTSGVGKTTLAKYISQRYRIPYVNGSSTVIWEKYGIKNHTELLEMGIKDPVKGLQFQLELLDVRKEALMDLDSFVTDRSVIDNLVYFLFQNSPFLSKNYTEHYLEKCRECFDISNGSIIKQRPFEDMKLIYLSRDFLPFDKMPLIEDDDKRITNEYYQDMMDEIFKHVLNKDILGLELDRFNFKKVRDYNWESRVNIVEHFIKEEPNFLEKYLRL